MFRPIIGGLQELLFSASNASKGTRQPQPPGQDNSTLQRGGSSRAVERRIDIPVSFIDAPQGIRADAKKKLVKNLYEAIHEPYPIQDTRILLREWPNDTVSQDGRLESGPLRPICWLEVPPAISIEAKRQLVSRLSDAISEAYRLPKEDVRLPIGTARPNGDEMHIAVSPVLVGSWEHLFNGINALALHYQCTEHVATADAMHFAIRKRDG